MVKLVWRLSFILWLVLASPIILFRLIQSRGFNYRYYFLCPETYLGKFFYGWRDKIQKS